MARRRFGVVVGLMVVAAGLLGACSDHGSHTGAGMHDDGSMMDGGMDGSMHQHGANSKPFAGARTVEVAARSFRFTPNRIEVAVGERVNIRLTSTDVLHDFTVGGQAVHVVARAGRTATGGMRLTEVGTYTFTCTVPGHRAAGMRGTIVVSGG